jgi:hypothetical protein
VPWHVLPPGHWEFEEHGSPTCDPPASLEACASAPPLPPLLLAPLLLAPPLLEAPVVPSPPLEPSSEAMLSVPTA